MIGSIYCSTGAFSRDPDLTDPFAILTGISELEADGFELIFYPSFYDGLEGLVSTLSPVSDKLRVLHTEKSIGPLLGSGGTDEADLGLHRLQTNARFASELGIDRLVLHLWGRPESDENIHRNLSFYARCNEIVEEHGCRLTIESIPCTRDTPLTHLRTLADQHQDVLFTLDTEFLSMHDELNTAVGDKQIMDRTSQIHLKDFDGSLVDENGERTYLHPGEGLIDFSEVLLAVRDASHPIDLCIESTSVQSDGSVDFDQAQRDIDYFAGIRNDVQEKAEDRPS